MNFDYESNPGRPLENFLEFFWKGCRLLVMDPTYGPWIALWSMGGARGWHLQLLKSEFRYV